MVYQTTFDSLLVELLWLWGELLVEAALALGEELSCLFIDRGHGLAIARKVGYCKIDGDNLVGSKLNIQHGFFIFLAIVHGLFHPLPSKGRLISLWERYDYRYIWAALQKRT